jgi:hypothetical protein
MERDQIRLEISKQIRMVRAKYGNDMRIDSFEKRVKETIDEYKREEKLFIIGLFVLIVIMLLMSVFLR